VQAAQAQGRPSPDTFMLGTRRTHVKRHAPIDFVKLAAALGSVSAGRVSARSDARESIRRMLTSSGPALLEADTPMLPAR
jgi:thiamine pyrophosphate-dependent acetolactate synthase large subunit-like protein